MSATPLRLSSPDSCCHPLVQMISQTYSLAHLARRKLAREASRPDLHLFRLVGHANLLDSLMLELGRAEREQQQHALKIYKAGNTDGPRHIQWADCVIETEEMYNVSEDAESDIDSEGEYDMDECADMEADMISLQRVPSHRNLSSENSPNIVTHTSLMSFSDEDYEDGDFDVLQLEYTPCSSPPELDHDSDSSEDEAMPPSPPASHSHSFLETKFSTDQFSKTEGSDNMLTETPSIFDELYCSSTFTQ